MVAKSNGKYALVFSGVAIALATIAGAVNYGTYAGAADAATRELRAERSERIAADNELRSEWVGQVRGLNERIDRILELRASKEVH